MDTVNAIVENVNQYLSQDELAVPQKKAVNRSYASNYANSRVECENRRYYSYNGKGERIDSFTVDRQFLDDVERYNEKQNNWSWDTTNPLFSPCCEPKTFVDPNLDYDDSEIVVYSKFRRNRSLSTRSASVIQDKEREFNKHYSDDSSPSSSDSWVPDSVFEAMNYLDFFNPKPSKIDKEIKKREKDLNLPKLIDSQSLNSPEYRRQLPRSRTSSRRFVR